VFFYLLPYHKQIQSKKKELSTCSFAIFSKQFLPLISYNGHVLTACL
jgi:hypothetical protein